ncbi:MAG: hypothetical protein V8R91_15175 [Butyricimonas faecihominis]
MVRESEDRDERGRTGLAYTEDRRGFGVRRRRYCGQMCRTGCWNEMESRDFVNDSVIFHTAAGEVEAIVPGGTGSFPEGGRS